MTLAPEVAEGFRLLAAGRLAEAEAVADARLREAPADAGAWHLAGVLHAKNARAPQACEALERAAALAPADARVRLDLGNARLDAAQLEAAQAAYAEAARLRPDWPLAAFNLGIVLRRQSRWLDAARAFARVTRLQPADFPAMQACVDCVAEHARTAPAPPPQRPAPREAAAPLTVAYCSPDEARLGRCRERLRPHVEAGGHELLPILAPRSLAAAYNEAADRAAHEGVVLMHDDVEFVSPDPFGALSRALASHDVVGLAGSQRAGGPAVLWSGHPFLHGWVSYPAAEGEGFVAAPMSLAHGLIGGMQTLDGLLIAARREALRRVRFDAATFDGFHFYDLDFTVRAHRAGLRIAVTTGVLAVHQSHGDFGAEWQRYAERFRAKFPELSSPAGQSHWYAARLPDRRALLAFHAALGSLGDAGGAP